MPVTIFSLQGTDVLQAYCLEVSDVPGVWRECYLKRQQETYLGRHTDSANL